MTGGQDNHPPSLSRRGFAARLACAGTLALSGGAVPLAIPLAPAAAQSRSGLTFFRIGTGPTAGTLYGLGTAISAGISRPPGSAPCDIGGICGVPGLIAVALSRGGSIVNLQSLAALELESALVHADMAFWAYRGSGPFKAAGHKLDRLRIIANLTPVLVHVVVRGDSDIKSPADLAGRAVSLGPQGSGTVTISDLLLKAYGLDSGMLEPHYMKPGPAADALGERRLDAMIEIGGEPVDAIADLATRMDIRILGIDRAAVRHMHNRYPFFSHGTIAEGVYDHVPAVETLRLGSYWVTRADIDDALVEAMTRALWQGNSRELFLQNNPKSSFPDINEGSRFTTVPYHDGALAYYKSVGLR